MYIPYPKMLYHDSKPHIIVKNIEEHLIKQEEEGYHTHDGKLISKKELKEETKKEEIKKEEVDVFAPVFPELKKQKGKLKKG